MFFSLHAQYRYDMLSPWASFTFPSHSFPTITNTFLGESVDVLNTDTFRPFWRTLNLQLFLVRRHPTAHATLHAFVPIPLQPLSPSRFPHPAPFQHDHPHTWHLVAGSLQIPQPTKQVRPLRVRRRTVCAARWLYGIYHHVSELGKPRSGRDDWSGAFTAGRTS